MDFNLAVAKVDRQTTKFSSYTVILFPFESTGWSRNVLLTHQWGAPLLVAVACCWCRWTHCRTYVGWYSCSPYCPEGENNMHTYMYNVISLCYNTILNKTRQGSSTTKSYIISWSIILYAQSCIHMSTLKLIHVHVCTCVCCAPAEQLERLLQKSYSSSTGAWYYSTCSIHVHVTWWPHIHVHVRIEHTCTC